MGEYQVTCINKLHPQGSHEQITHIGNNDKMWRLSIEAAVAAIESDQSQFYTLDPVTGNKSYLVVIKEKGKPSYLRCHFNCVWNDKLLAQPECGKECKLVA